METKPPIPPFTIETARQKVRLVFDDVAGNNFFNTLRVRVRRTTLISEMPELRWPLVVPASPCSSCATGETFPEAQSPVPHPSTEESK
jgi:hypothetical protein